MCIRNKDLFCTRLSCCVERIETAHYFDEYECGKQPHIFEPSIEISQSLNETIKERLYFPDARTHQKTSELIIVLFWLSCAFGTQALCSRCYRAATVAASRSMTIFSLCMFFFKSLCLSSIVYFFILVFCVYESGVFV